MRKKSKTIITVAAMLLLLLAASPLAAKLPEGLEPVKYAYADPERPYDAINYGLFDYQTTSSTKTPRGGADVERATSGVYSIFIPEGSQPKLRTVVILVPDRTTAFDFARSAEGMAWIEEARTSKAFAVVFAEPQGGRWNTALAEPTKKNRLRDDLAFAYDIFKSIRSKSITANAYLSSDKSRFSLVGYKEGAGMAALAAAAWPGIWSSVLLVEPVSFNSEGAAALLADGCYPHVLDNNKNWGSVLNGQVGMPMRVVPGADAAPAEAIVGMWKAVNEKAVSRLKDTTARPDLLVSTLVEKRDVKGLAQLATSTIRVLGYPGGTVREEVDWDGPGFETFEGKFGSDPLLRRWRVYTPASRPAGEKVPMVVVLHGSSSAITDIGNESRWTEVADANGFVVLFIQGYPAKGMAADSAPIPGWNMMDNKPTNPDLHYIKAVVDKVVHDKRIDPGRIYLTGHSLGSMMIGAVMRSGISGVFAAYAPVGMLFIPQMFKTTSRTVTPCWAFLGQFDMQGPGFKANPRMGAFGYEGGAAAQEWARLFGFPDAQTVPEPRGEAPYAKGKFTTWEWKDASGAPLVRYTVAADSPHIYMAEEARLVWDRFFSRISRLPNGQIEYAEPEPPVLAPTTPLEPVALQEPDPAAPYDTLFWGLFTGQKAVGTDPGAKRGEEAATAEATYALFIPKGTQTRSPLAIILVPNGMTAEEFARGPVGMDWMGKADGPDKFAVAFVEPEDGVWNTACDAGRRDEALAVYGVFKQINSTSKSANAFYSLDKNRVSLAGYDEGAEAALLAATAYPAAYANLALVGLESFDAGRLEANLARPAFPYLTSKTSGLGEMTNAGVPMPLAVVGGSEASGKAAGLYKGLQEAYKSGDSTFEPRLLKVSAFPKVTASELYDGFMSLNGRYLGYPGGTIRGNFAVDGAGFEMHDRILEGGGFNRYLTYVPASLDRRRPAPLVVVLHGASAAVSDLVSESRWSALADRDGFVVLYAQAPMGGKKGGPYTPGWPMAGPGALRQILGDIAEVQAERAIDPGRIYLTGHSAGGMAIGMSIIPEASDVFAAYAINGGFMAGFARGPMDLSKFLPKGKVLPVIGFMAQYDGFPYQPEAVSDHIKAFALYSGLDASQPLVESEVQEGYPKEKYQYYDMMLGAAPVVRYTTVLQSPHTFMAEEAALSWDYFKRWERTPEGLRFDGELLN